ncbi:hypothetical protein ACJ73_05047 [Blastomyces percursus]|uniref:Uncharacterized protein n=1 Tax=Blastomyces percursus TaxID=1658174 RepID=A0A1J9QTP3_9EURO|nr:hypothetical protein ACJ73_05047 [Blastomyces percursus]
MANGSSRSTPQIGDYVYYRGSVSIGRIKQLFIHEIMRGARRLFAYLTPVRVTDSAIDNVLQLPICDLNRSAEVIVGLPNIGIKRLYMIPYGKAEESDQVLQCTWELDFM